MSKKLRITRYAELRSVQILAETKIQQISNRSTELKLNADALVYVLGNQVNPAGMNTKARREAKKLAALQVQPLSSMLNSIRQNLDPQMQAKFDANFNKIKKPHDALVSYMKGHKNKEVAEFLAKIPNMVAEQIDANETTIAGISAEKTKVDKKLKNKFSLFFLKVAYYLTPNHMSPEQLVAKKQGEKALVSRQGFGSSTTEAPNTSRYHASAEELVAEAKEVANVANAKSFGNAKPKVKFFDKEHAEKFVKTDSNSLTI